MKSRLSKAIAILLTFCVAFSGLPFLAGNLEANALAKKKKLPKNITLQAAVSGQTQVELKWNKIKSPSKGYAVFRDGEPVKHFNTKKIAFTDSNLEAGTSYTYQIKTYTKKTVKMWFNKKTEKWQKKKPAKKYRGKSKKEAVYTYKKKSNAVTVHTAATPAPSTPSDPTDTGDSDTGNNDSTGGNTNNQGDNAGNGGNDNASTEQGQTGDTDSTQTDAADPALDAIRKEMLESVNEERAKAGASPLTLQDAINECAQEKAIDLYKSGKLDHYSDTLGYVQDQFDKHGITASGVGENIAMGQNSVSAAMKDWVNSSGHYANIVKPEFTHVGFGYYNGYWVQQFAMNPRVQGPEFPDTAITCPRCGTTKKESEFNDRMVYTSTGPDGSIIKVYQCDCIYMIYLCPKCNIAMEDAGVSANGSVARACPKCGYSDSKECYVECGYCHAPLLDNTIEDDFVVHFQGDMSEGSRDFQEIQVELDYCKDCGKYAFINQASRMLYDTYYEEYGNKLEEGEDIYDHIKWDFLIETETVQDSENSWTVHRSRNEMPTPRVKNLEQLLGSERLYYRLNKTEAVTEVNL